MLLGAEGIDTSWSDLIRAVVFGFGFLVVLTFVFVAVLRAYVEFRKARVTAGNEEKLRDLVGRFEQLANTTLATQERTASEIAELRSRVTSVEQVLRSVDE